MKDSFSWLFTKSLLAFQTDISNKDSFVWFTFQEMVIKALLRKYSDKDNSERFANQKSVKKKRKKTYEEEHFHDWMLQTVFFLSWQQVSRVCKRAISV